MVEKQKEPRWKEWRGKKNENNHYTQQPHGEDAGFAIIRL